MRACIEKWVFACVALATCCASAGCSKKAPPEPSETASATSEPVTAAPSATPATAIERTVVPGSAGCDAHLAAAPPAPLDRTKCTPTEATAWAKDNNGACLDCLFASGCLDDKRFSEQECGDLPGGASEEKLCTAVLACNFGITPQRKPAPASGMTLNAFCRGGTPVETCAANPPGDCVAEWKAAFPGQNPHQILSNVGRKGNSPGSMANSISICANANCASCF